MTGASYTIEYQGEPMSLREFAKTTNTPYGVVVRRYRKGERNVLQLMRPPDERKQRRGNWCDPFLETC